VTTTAGYVLVIEPEGAYREPAVRFLHAAGFEAQAVASEQEAMELFANVRPDVILLTAGCPGLDAPAVLRRLRALIALDGVSVGLMGPPVGDAREIERLLDLGADDWLRRPVERLELVARVRCLLRLRRQVAQIKHERERMAKLHADLERLAIRDPLTGAYNRRYLEQRLAEEVERFQRYGQPFSVIAADIDWFKRINDTHGHVIGDVVLRAVATAMQRTVRRVDLLARLGGEEFLVVAPSTDQAGARVLAERLRAAVADVPIFASTGSGRHATVHTTASFGVATMHGGRLRVEPNAEALIEAADAALYRAKAQGRNRVEVHED
jgi:two-component system, cell cycle response regulator